MSFSEHSWVGALLSKLDEEPDARLKWSTDVQSQSLALIERSLSNARIYRDTEGSDFDEEAHRNLLDFLSGVGKVASDLAQQVRDTQEIPVK